MILSSFFLFAIGLLLVVLGLVLRIFVNRSKRNAFIPKGKIVFDDLHGANYSLKSRIYPLIGKPDLVVKRGWRLIPVEIKTGNHHEPKNHHIMQLIAYCQLVSEQYHKSVPYGFLIYPNTGNRFKIYFNRKRRKKLKKSLQQMNNAIDYGYIKRNHEIKNKCNNCKLKSVCNYKIE